jgi:hypothetical protein
MGGREDRPALTDPARAGCDNCGRDGRMLAARVEQKNGPTLHATLDQTIMSNQHETSVERMITMDGISDHHHLEFVITIIWND